LETADYRDRRLFKWTARRDDGNSIRIKETAMRRASLSRTLAVGVLLLGALLFGASNDALSSDRATAAIGLDPVATGLDYPAGFTFAPDGRIFYLERFTGEIRILDPDPPSNSLFGTVPDLVTNGERGLLGIALHPNYPATPHVFVFATRRVNTVPTNQIIRMNDSGGTATQPRVIWQSNVTNGGAYHQGGRILFGPDGNLWAVEGNHGPSANSQDLSNTGGKILRMEPDGDVPPDNPHPRSHLWAYGIRNSFGFAFDPQTGSLWETEAGPNCGDEINLIVKAGNYGFGPGATCQNLPESMNMSGPDPILPEWWWGPVITPVGIAFCEGCGLPDSEGMMYFTNWNFPSDINRAVLSADRTDILSVESLLSHTRNLISMEVAPDGALHVSDARAIYEVVAN
jgi:glucose/arabinose dehydrogenase